jgi:hypothetical protein
MKRVDGIPEHEMVHGKAALLRNRGAASGIDLEVESYNVRSSGLGPGAGP